MFAATTSWAVNIKRSLLKGKSKRKRIAVYLDNPDELFRASDPDLWTNVQQGLLLAIWKMQKGGALEEELNIYASVRTEAVSHQVHPDLQHALDLSLHLRYDKAMLAELFENQIALTEKTKLVLHRASVATNAIMAFVGFDEVIHHDRHNQNGAPMQEPFIGALLRHTRHVPRDVIAFGRQISQIRPEERNDATVRRTINAEANQIVKYVKANSFPSWPSKLEKLLDNIDAQVLSKAELNTLVCAYDKDNDGLVEYLVSTGLLGYAEPHPKRHRNYYIQRFAFDEPYGHTSGATHRFNFFFVHPALKEWIRGRSGRMSAWRPNPETLIGDGLPYESAPPVFHLGVSCNNQPVVLLNGNNPLQASEAQTSDPIRFLFLALWAWKLRGGRIWPTIGDLRQVRLALMQKHANLHFPNIESDQHASCSQVRDWAKKINQHKELKEFCAAQYTALQTSNLRRKSFITVSAKEASGAEAKIAFPIVNSADIYVDEDFYFAISL